MMRALAGAVFLATLLAVGCDTGGGASAAGEDLLAGGDDASSGGDVAPDTGERPTDEIARLCEWADHPGNPVIAPPSPETIIGDPAVVRPAEAPDGRWHLFANSIFSGVHHFTSDDGIAWTEEEERAVVGAGAMRAFVLEHEDRWYLFYEQFIGGIDNSEIRRIDSEDLFSWSEPTTVIVPDRDWEQTLQSTVGNPCVVSRDGQWWLYYSADGVHQDDTGFNEPRVIGLARADSLDGSWVKEPGPISAPDATVDWRNEGAGSLKLLPRPIDGHWYGFQNGIFLDEDGHSRSAIHVVRSVDGLVFEEVCGPPALAPSGEGWKRAFVYASIAVPVEDGLRLYYNARDGWADGSERIGFATSPFRLLDYTIQ